MCIYDIYDVYIYNMYLAFQPFGEPGLIGIYLYAYTLPPIIMVQLKIGPSNSSYFSKRAVFHWTMIMGERVYIYIEYINNGFPNGR